MKPRIKQRDRAKAGLRAVQGGLVKVRLSMVHVMVRNNDCKTENHGNAKMKQ